MYVVSVTIRVRPEHVQEFVEATLANCRGTRQEPGNVHFHFLQSNDDSSRFLLYEAYRREEDFTSHQRTPHYRRWKEIVAEWMAAPREGVKHRSLFPSDAGWEAGGG